MLKAFFVPALAVGLAELGDKSQLSLFLLSSQTHKRMSLFWGALLGFVLVDGAAVLLGESVSRVVPASVMQLVAGGLFILIGGYMIYTRKAAEKGERKRYANPFVSGFAVIFLTEWGDKTQLASLVFAAKYNSLMVLAGITTALAILSVAAIFLGSYLQKRIRPKIVHTAAGLIFVVLGVLCLI